MRLRRTVIATLPLLAFAAVACAPVDDEETVADPAPSSESDRAGTETEDVDACATESLPTLEAGTLTIGTDSPAYEPWFTDNDPTNGKGYESAVAYAVAEQLGFAADQVTWVTVPFNTSYAPGPKKFDFDVNQISITPARAEVVDFSEGYYSAAQAVIALKGSPVSEVTSIADLADYNLGAQTGTTSLTAIREVINPANDPAVFEDTNAAKQALLNGQVDGILADLPTAFYISAVEIPDSAIIGQFQVEDGDEEEFGMLFEKGSPLVDCVDGALEALDEDGTLDALEQQWLSDVVSVPELQ
ncbi:amino acid ABC transporter substrate-binding protein [Nocardioides psychrotolerans]|uniref:Polar amino acid transport system substrate-binding protein n=1 Tax=Nocardioides psychrotolerans TaxID=1005945 RepID=A0A1I3G754_9ACTN|nr:ABC transporter substrate-binding protein [Nocardioides psychrotolerans]GEP40623.1 amino acid ABC transporter substrate-binding protein [Nocardioides psychrotolerans]SFI19320.1 polar amino acid transport system substrate-binding protein [Nocardioides psychrotolerans]